jgi:DNA polymerase-1
MFDIKMEDVNKPFPERPNYTYRFVSKSCSFLAMYGGNEFTLADRIQVPKEKAKALLAKYFAALPLLKKFLDMLATTAVTYGQIRSDPYYKRIRWFPNLKEDDWKTIGETQREAMNMPMQSQNANLIKECIINLQREIDNKGYDVKLLLQIHDAILSEAEDSIAEMWKETQECIMIETISKHITSVPVKVSTTMGKHWNH